VIDVHQPPEDDVESAITSLEQRLRALQADLDTEPRPAPAAPVRAHHARVETASSARDRWAPPRPPARRQADPHPRPATPSPSPSPSDHLVDALERFGADLRRLTGELADAWDRVVEDVRGAQHDHEVFSGEVAIEVEARLGTLAAIDAALTGIPRVRSVELRAYAGRRALLDVTLDGEIALVRELRDTLGHPFTVRASGPGLLAIELSGADTP
jgi:hypothetical protein